MYVKDSFRQQLSSEAHYYSGLCMPNHHEYPAGRLSQDPAVLQVTVKLFLIDL